MTVSRYQNFALGWLIITNFLLGSVQAKEKAWVEAMKNGDANLSFRTRVEMVDQGGIAQEATAQTILSRLNYTTREHNQWRLKVEFDNVSSFVDDYNSTVNGNTVYPIVADPVGSDLNLFNLQYRHKGLKVKLGR